jgi:nicotinate-nucleotide adenylyltransferase
MGGSFNPAHAGHIHISLVALSRLNLHEIWWLVTPQNPLKSTTDMEDLDQRLEQASVLAQHPRIRVTDIEKKLGTRYTVDTVRVLRTQNPSTKFVWVMGADNFIELPKWRDWAKLMDLIPMAVIARPGTHLRAGLSQAALRFGRNRINASDARLLPYLNPPAWGLIMDRLNPLSSTNIRADKTIK